MTESIAILPDGTIMNPDMGKLLGEYGVNDVTTNEQASKTTAVVVGTVAVEGAAANAFTTDWEQAGNPADPNQVKRLIAMAGINAHGDDTPRPTLSA